MPVLGCAGFVFYLSSLSSPHAPHFQFSDKVYHVIAYATLGFLWVRALRPSERGWSLWKILALAFAGCLLYGLSDEYHQSFIPHRAVEVADVATDAIGGVLGGIFYRICPAFMK